MNRARGALEQFEPTGRDRVLVAAPHPDDEVISSGLVLQRTLAAGGRARVVILTHGDAFGYRGPAPARGIAVRRRTGLGELRRRESEAALASLGVAPDDIEFLGYPDRGLAALWSRHWSKGAPYRSPFTYRDRSPYPGCFTPDAVYAGEQLLADLKAILAAYRPTLLIHPHGRDVHGDHWATAAFLLAALEELGEEGAHWIKKCRRLEYIVHRGWPVPRTNGGEARMLPPSSLWRLGGVWRECAGTQKQVEAKRAAVLHFRSQLPFLGRFLLGFVRRSEVFFEGRVPVAIRMASPLVGGGDWPKRPTLPDPVGDAVPRQLEKAADIVGIDVASDGRLLYLRLRLVEPAAPDVDYRVQLVPSPRRPPLVLRFRPPNRVTWRDGSRWRLLRGAVARATGNEVCIAIPGALLGHPAGVFVSAETRTRRIAVDRTGVHLVRMGGWHKEEPPIVYAVATPAEIAACAQLFMNAFRESIQSIFRTMPRPRLVQQVFRLCIDAEPEGFMVALCEGRVIGYVFAPSSLRRLGWTALSQGHITRWIGGWIRGRFGLGLGPLRILLLDTFHFVRSSVGGAAAAEARILSIAVDPEFRGRGVASRLVRHALARLREKEVTKVRLEVRPWNEPAVRLYERLGFQVVGRTRDTRGEWLIMMLDLSVNVG